MHYQLINFFIQVNSGCNRIFLDKIIFMINEKKLKNLLEFLNAIVLLVNLLQIETIFIQPILQICTLNFRSYIYLYVKYFIKNYVFVVYIPNLLKIQFLYKKFYKNILFRNIN
jgi:hypothetical protein